ncbi:ABC transporter permease [Azospirillum brasilense]|uniref:ABC transporter n=1 Tax=Azospirillum brasilense TaxID=192 RepID=A0A235HD10_AZOBR|nr:ABC transporter permease [Azospirillum brasilense]OYD83616.1 ABC transporter [Azospirillum brasilense]
MLLYTLTRLAYLAMVLVVMSILVFLVTQAMPGDVASMIAGQFASKEVIDAITVKLGLDQPLIVQYGRWAAGILQGDLGRSLVLEQPVAPILMEALSRSLVLAVVALAVVTVIGIGAGVLAAVRRGRMADQMVSGVSYLGIAVPDFFWAIVLVLVFGSYLKWLPTGGYAPLADGFVPWASHLVLPVVTLVLMLIARIARLTRSSMIDVLQTNYVKYARAKGLPEKVVIVRHALRNALLPTITVLAIDFGLILGGVVVIETVFSFPGMGRLLLFAIQRHDLPLIQATILIISTAYCLANLAADLLYAFVNPKIRHGMGSA